MVEMSHPILLQARKMGTTVRKGEEKIRTSRGIWKTRIFRPEEYEYVYEKANEKYRIIFSCLLMTGMRYEELRRLRKHPEWIDRNGFILLPAEAQKKEKRSSRERFIRLSYRGREAIKRLFDLEADLPANITVDNYIKYNFREIEGFSLKSFRKTWESWLVFYFQKPLNIAESQGHTMLTQLNHYISLPFTEEDKMKMRPYVEGWI